METTAGLLQLYWLLYRELQVIEVGLLSSVPNQRLSWSHWNRGLSNVVSFKSFSLFIVCAFLCQQLRIPNLTMNEVYEVKVQAASLSIFNPTKLQIGDSMLPKTVSWYKVEAHKVSN